MSIPARLLLLAFAMTAALPAMAQTPPAPPAAAPAAAATTPQRIRGAVTGLDGQMLKVKTREGADVSIKLADAVVVSAVKAIDLKDIAPGSYIGTATMKRPDGTYRALEVLVFPEAARGTGEGKFPWDLEPESTMINATVGMVAAASDGQTIEATHKGVTDKIVVPSGVPVVTFVPADKALLTPGTKVFIGAQKAADGSLSAGRVVAGKDGVDPPM